MIVGSSVINRWWVRLKSNLLFSLKLSTICPLQNPKRIWKNIQSHFFEIFDSFNVIAALVESQFLQCSPYCIVFYVVGSLEVNEENVKIHVELPHFLVIGGRSIYQEPNFLHDSFQIVKISRSDSIMFKTPSDIPLGSNFGPLIFISFH